MKEELFIWYEDKPTRIYIKEEKEDHKIVVTENGDILCVPYGNKIFNTQEECEYYHNNPYCDWVTQ